MRFFNKVGRAALKQLWGKSLGVIVGHRVVLDERRNGERKLMNLGIHGLRPSAIDQQSVTLPRHDAVEGRNSVYACAEGANSTAIPSSIHARSAAAGELVSNAMSAAFGTAGGGLRFRPSCSRIMGAMTVDRVQSPYAGRRGFNSSPSRTCHDVISQRVDLSQWLAALRA
jgi:hypothetical protein